MAIGMSEIEWMEIFSNNLTEIMRETGYSQEQLARETGISQATISRYINRQQIPSVKSIINIVYALNCDLRELIDFGDIIV